MKTSVIKSVPPQTAQKKKLLHAFHANAFLMEESCMEMTSLIIINQLSIIIMTGKEIEKDVFSLVTSVGQRKRKRKTSEFP